MKQSRKIICLFLFISLLFFECLNAQDLKYGVNIGTTLGETKLIKKLMLNSEAFIGYESDSKNYISFSISAGISRLKFDYYDTTFNQIYNQRVYITLPVEIKKYFQAPNPKNSMFFGLGLVGNLCISDKREVRSLGITKTLKENFTGFNIGATGMIGFRSYLTKSSSIAISILSQVNIANYYAKDDYEIKFQKSLLSFTYATRISREK